MALVIYPQVANKKPQTQIVYGLDKFLGDMSYATPFSFFIASVSLGTTSKASPTMP